MKKRKPKRKRTQKIPGQLWSIKAVREWLERGGVMAFHSPSLPGMVGVDVEWDDDVRKLKFTVRQCAADPAADALVAVFHMALPVTDVQLKYAAEVVKKKLAGERGKEGN